jgi:hypothetical protein
MMRFSERCLKQKMGCNGCINALECDNEIVNFERTRVMIYEKKRNRHQAQQKTIDNLRDRNKTTSN